MKKNDEQKLRRLIREIIEQYEEVSSDLFRESGFNASTSQNKINEFAKEMKYGWGDFPPIHGVLQQVDLNDLEEFEEAVEGGYEHELAWSRSLTNNDIGKIFVAIEDGHNRAYAAMKAGIPIRVKVW